MTGWVQRKDPGDAHYLRPLTSAQGQAGWVMGASWGTTREGEEEGESKGTGVRERVRRDAELREGGRSGRRDGA